MAVTLKDIAEECGVSRQAVSLAINNGAGLTAATRERILRVVEEKGYRPSSFGRMMRTRRFGSVALLLSTRAGWISQQLLHNIHDALAQHDLHLTVVRLPDEKLTDEAVVPRILSEWMCDGLLVNYITGAPPLLVNLIERHHIPSVWLNVRREADCVFPDDVQASRTATQHLIKAGHCRIDFLKSVIEGEQRHYSEKDREQGYQSAMREAGLKPRCVDYKPQVTRSAMSDAGVRWLQQKQRPSAVLTYGEGEALLMLAAALKVGLRVPEDLSLMTFHTELLSTYAGFDQIYLPWESIAQTAVEMLLQKMGDPDLTLPPTAVPGVLIAGETVTPPAR
jgi:DNA-binding LacI/PurR family transcriptional regulator